MHTDTDIFLHPLRRLSPPPPANSHAKTACSDTLTEAGYARCGDENQPTVLSWILLSDLPILRDGTACHACIHFFELINIMLHAQIYTEKRKSERNWLFTRPLTIYKKNCYTVASDGKMKLFLSFSPSVTKGKPFFFILSRVAYVSQILNSLLLVPNYPKQEFCQFHWLGYIKNR